MGPERGTSHDPFLIVAGTYRAGSTALFSYLADHPQVAAANQKETGFFLSVDDGAESAPRVGREPLETYLARFDKTVVPPAVKVEATPGYLYEPDAPRLINEMLPSSRVVITLRDQVPWLASWYTTIVLMEHLDAGVSFEEYIELQLNDPRPLRQRPVVFRAIEEGRYARYVQAFIDEFGRDRVMVLWFDDLTTSTRTTMEKVARFGGLDPSFYADYAQKPVNVSARMSSRRIFNLYMAVRPGLMRSARIHPAIEAFVKKRIDRVDWWVVRRSTKPAEKPTVSPDVEAKLREFYRADNAHLATVVGRPVPWADRSHPHQPK